MKTELITAAMVITLGAALFVPQPAQAGDKEIAAAFAGFAAAAAWMNHHQQSEREQACEVVPARHGYMPAQRRGIAYSPSRRYPARGSTYRRCAPPLGPVVRYSTPQRRVYQPRVHGHPAYVQVWSPRRRAWISVGRHPSIW